MKVFLFSISSCRSSKRGKKSSRKSGEKQNGEKSSSSDSDSDKVRIENKAEYKCRLWKSKNLLKRIDTERKSLQ